MKRCQKCGGYYGEPKKVNVGEKCCFTITTSRDGRSFNSRAVTGKLTYIFGKNCYSVVYRKTVYYVEHITHPDDPSPIMLAFSESCNCPRR
ncbi:hypothetical protein [Xenorhabdus cabanillasii]|uniref:Uncharacterized protein n=1 Tax=Xenorhabdus cabanillasii JM26 TaxID=1427517 RepID=W1J8F5_9GAMM|nr:hypothetical protein [Xenorhabdus cabanillasii]PHM76927.1 hypothetical protein Xcab_02494 [Xenorhabdus cabanillasii JM26]CDL86303.1 conserved hypothetical protein [Xenorhabdus cabanillasii JM26]